MPHFTERRRSGSVLAASASTVSAMPRCGCGRLAMYAKTGLSPTAAFAGLALPGISSGSVAATSICAAVRVVGFWTSLLPVSFLVMERLIPDASGAPEDVAEIFDAKVLRSQAQDSDSLARRCRFGGFTPERCSSPCLTPRNGSLGIPNHQYNSSLAITCGSQGPLRIHNKRANRQLAIRPLRSGAPVSLATET